MKNKIIGFLTATIVFFIITLLFFLDVFITDNIKLKRANKKNEKYIKKL